MDKIINIQKAGEHKSIDINLDNFDLNNDKTEINLTKSPSPTKKSNIGLDLLINTKKSLNENVSNFSPKPSEGIKEDKEINNLFSSNNNNNNNSSSLEDQLNIVDIGSSDNNSSKQDNVSQSNELKIDDLEFNLNNLNENSSSNEFIDLNVSDLNNNSNNSSNSNNTFSSVNVEDSRPKSYDEIQKEKFKILCALERLQSRGIRLEKRFNMESDYDEMKRELERITLQRESEASVKFQRKMLIAFVTGIEFLNNRFDPFDIKLDGWSENVHEGINDYDDVFEELHEKYKDKSKMAPELKLLMMLGGSAFMFHLTNTMFKSTLPGMGDIMRQNPDLMNQFAKAAAGSMAQNDPQSSGFNNFMGDVMNSGIPKQKPQPTRHEMKPPPNIDNLLNNLGKTNSSSNKLNLDNLSDLSESDVDNTRNINISNNRREINLDI